MKLILKIFKSLLLIEILTLYTNSIFLDTSYDSLRKLCAFLTIGMLIQLSVYSGHKIAESAGKQHILLKNSMIIGLGFVSSLPFLICWCILLLARMQIVNPEFYGIYQFLCAPFMSICQMFSEDTSASSIPVSEMFTLLMLSFLPMICFCLNCKHKTVFKN